MELVWFTWAMINVKVVLSEYKVSLSCCSFKLWLLFLLNKTYNAVFECASGVYLITIVQVVQCDM